MRYQITIFIILFFSFCLNAFGQLKGVYSSSESNFNPNYIKSYTDSLIIKLATVQKFTRLEIEDTDSEKTLGYSPNRDLSIGAGVQYKWFGLTFSYKIPWINNDNDIYGETEQLDLQASFYLRKFVVDFNLHRYKGFYVDQPKDLYPNWDKGQAYPQRGDLVTMFMSGDLYYIFNHKKFSYRAAFLQNELQKKSAGSFIAGAYFSRLRIEAESNIIGPELEHLFSKQTHFEKASYNNYGVSIGYAHTFVIKKKFFISFSPSLGFSVQSNKVFNVDPELNSNNTEVAPKVFYRMALGYNWDKYFVAVTSQAGSFLLNSTEHTVMGYSVGNVRVFVGRKFNIN